MPRWEAATSFLHTNDDNVSRWGEEDFAVAVARIECHYFVNKGFLEREDELLRGVRRIRHIPAVIVQGRYDVVCPMMTQGSPLIFFTRPISAVFMALAFLSIGRGIWAQVRAQAPEVVVEDPV